MIEDKPLGENLTEIQKQGKVFYAIRGETPRIEAEWSRIVDYKFRQKQGYGNAVKVNNFQRAKEFAESKAHPEGFFQRNCSCMKKQSRLVKFIAYTVGGNLILYLLWNALILFEDQFGCRSYWNADYWFCKDAERMRSLVTANKETIQAVMVAEGVALLSAFAVYAKTLFN